MAQSDDFRIAKLAGASKLSDPGLWSRIESWYRERSPTISEVSIVPLDGAIGQPPHIHAFLVPSFEELKKWKRANARELIRFEFQTLSKQLPVEERPDTFSLRSRPLPRTTGDALDSSQVRKEFSHATGSISPTSPIKQQLSNLLRVHKPIQSEFEDNMNIELDLGFDSLERVQLLSEIERNFGVRIPDDEAAQIFTVGDLVGTVTKRAKAPPLLSSSSWSQILEAPLTLNEETLANTTFQDRMWVVSTAWALLLLLRLAGKLCFDLRVEGRHHLPKDRSFLFAVNHCSHLDPLFLLWSLPFGIMRRLSFMGHTEYFGTGWKARVSPWLKLVPVDPDQHVRSGMRLSAEALRRKLVGCVFPEGERSPNGALQRFHRGIAILARECKVPVVPAAILGSYEVFPRGAQQFRCSPVQVRFGQPVHAEDQDTDLDFLAHLWKAVRDLRGNDNYAREPIPEILDI
ncbi:1-acyl-sn-glycerol-3-phosphate acyltransferase [Edaphobacter aggregans]|uniref:1-acyl-sn-glycerol-3-phosphate acyltransferase n=1 Tax=Edaphobacter aggregans TaxID=570835 RepID=UPI00068FE70C|nr:1-acyl-sn-glycerol-3-phosphate acyltransferase [Edaphobacter aggregans]